MTYIVLPEPSGSGSAYYGDPVANFAALPVSGATGEVRLTLDTLTFYVWDGAAWKREGQITARQLVPITDGSSAGAGEVGEVLVANQTQTASGVGASGAWGAVTSLSVTAGVWQLSGMAGMAEAGASLETSCSVGISSTADGSGLGSYDYAEHPYMTTGTTARIVAPPLLISIGATTVYYLNTRFYYSAGTPQHLGRLSARRIA